MKTLIVALVLFSISSPGFASSKKKSNKQRPSISKSMKEDFATLGDNRVLAERVRNMETDRKVRIVQNRIVDLNNRLELSVGYGLNGGGGDSYVITNNLSGQADFHFSPRWAVGLRYEKHYNDLSKEAQAQIARAEADTSGIMLFPNVDYPLSSTLATVTYAPIYGKLNLFDFSVAHFDVYTMLGAGKLELRSGDSNLYTAGLGLSVWLTQHFSTRLESRYEAYQDLIGTHNRDQRVFKGMITIGFLL